MKATRLNICLAIFLVCLLGWTSGVAHAANFAVMIKSGTVKLWDQDQRLDGVERHYDNNSERTMAVAWEIRNTDELALGMEYLNYRHEFSPPVTGHTRTQVLQFTIKKYFSPMPILHPYAGVGLGWGYDKSDDGLGNVDRDYNFAAQASVGVELKFGNHFGFYTELKGLASGTGGEDDNEFDFSGTGLLGGISFIF